MNKPLTQAEIAAFSVPLPTPMSRHDKLMRWAWLVERQDGAVSIFHNLEYRTQEFLDCLADYNSAMTLAASDQTLQAEGLKDATVGSAQRFFELSKEDLHSFSCDCGGAISNKTMAERIRKIAAGGNQKPMSKAALIASCLVLMLMPLSLWGIG